MALSTYFSNALLSIIALGVLGAYFYFSPLSLIESLQSSAGFFFVFGLIYGGAKVYYGKEVFGKGDWWLSLGLGSFTPLSHLPHFFTHSVLIRNRFYIGLSTKIPILTLCTFYVYIGNRVIYCPNLYLICTIYAK